MCFLANENFNNEIIRGLERRVSEVDITRVQDTELAGEPDTLVLEWTVEHDFIVLTHDVNTMRGYFYERISMPNYLYPVCFSCMKPSRSAK